jgi:hypothetical protein
MSAYGWKSLSGTSPPGGDCTPCNQRALRTPPCVRSRPTRPCWPPGTRREDRRLRPRRADGAGGPVLRRGEGRLAGAAVLQGGRQDAVRRRPADGRLRRRQRQGAVLLAVEAAAGQLGSPRGPGRRSAAERGRQGRVAHACGLPRREAGRLHPHGGGVHPRARAGPGRAVRRADREGPAAVERVRQALAPVRAAGLRRGWEVPGVLGRRCRSRLEGCDQDGAHVLALPVLRTTMPFTSGRLRRAGRFAPSGVTAAESGRRASAGTASVWRPAARTARC